jgi:hypothetical protein
MNTKVPTTQPSSESCNPYNSGTKPEVFHHGEPLPEKRPRRLHQILLDDKTIGSAAKVIIRQKKFFTAGILHLSEVLLA